MAGLTKVIESISENISYLYLVILNARHHSHARTKVKLEMFESSLILGMYVSLQKLEEQDKKALNTKEQLQREHRYLKRRLEQLSVSGSVERIRTDSLGSTISTDSEQGTALLTSSTTRGINSRQSRVCSKSGQYFVLVI